MKLTGCILLLPLFLATVSNAAGLEQFSTATSSNQEQIYREAISACRAIIGQKTSGSQVSIANPCPSNNWKGITTSEHGLSIVFRVKKATNSHMGLLETAIRRNAVIVTCQTDMSAELPVSKTLLMASQNDWFWSVLL